MASSYIRRTRKDRKCIDCGKVIKVDEKYYNDSRKGRKTIYCMECKKKPEHCRKNYDHDEIFMKLMKKPMFKHEFDKLFGFNSSGTSNNTIRRLMMKGYMIRIFRWNKRSRNLKLLSKNESYKHNFQPNQFIIYYVEGTEDKVVKRILDAFEYEDVTWKGLLRSLYGIPVPKEIVDKNSLLIWANQNVFKYVTNSRQQEIRK